MTEPPRPRVQSIDRAVSILRCFDATHPELGITELAGRTGLSTSTVHRLLGSMADNELVRQTTDRRYALGPLVVRLAHGGALASTWRTAALPLAKQLRDEVNETVGIHEHLPGGRRAVVDQVESRQELRRTYTEFGIPIPIAHGAPGKAMLAYLPVAEQERVLTEPIAPATDRTITDPDRLRVDLALIRERGWAYSDAERTPGIRSFAAPVLDFGGTILGAIGLSVPALRVTETRKAEFGERIRAVAFAVSRELGASEESLRAAVERATPPAG
ncbi:IclR family transcriptional regulator [Ornithinicoccus hortensis]|uniref:Glycerol operon regulatory protein n=1 Tax=Ornithinicoccus hortensis TaxID=82346 RepID=A0A542YQV9_9MICO|nr:IclR family transcriptional regulator [Ornithinicoccus hortensis]TQL50486.1 IclR family transcriptional regulator [Ornithinicoccus hortensis]